MHIIPHMHLVDDLIRTCSTRRVVFLMRAVELSTRASISSNNPEQNN